MSDSQAHISKGGLLKNVALLGTALAIGAGALVVTHKSHAADHLDAPTVKMTANAMADIDDVYTWMSSDNRRINLAMTVSPGDDGTRHFGPSVQYVFHLTSRPGATNADAIGAPGTESKIICTFTSDTAGQCWITRGTTLVDYIKGDFSGTAGQNSVNSHMKVFAGRRSDPFFFNLGGFHKAQAAVEGAGATFGADGCPNNILPITAATVRADLSSTITTADAPCPANVADCFAGLNVMAIAIEVDKSAVLQGSDHLLSVWGSTHAPL